MVVGRNNSIDKASVVLDTHWDSLTEYNNILEQAQDMNIHWEHIEDIPGVGVERVQDKRIPDIVIVRDAAAVAVRDVVAVVEEVERLVVFVVVDMGFVVGTGTFSNDMLPDSALRKSI